MEDKEFFEKIGIEPTMETYTNCVTHKMCEELILTQDIVFKLVQKYGYPLWLDDKPTGKIDWNFIYIAEEEIGCDEFDCKIYKDYEGMGKTRKQALLNLVTKLIEQKILTNEEVKKVFE